MTLLQNSQKKREQLKSLISIISQKVNGDDHVDDNRDVDDNVDDGDDNDDDGDGDDIS